MAGGGGRGFLMAITGAGRGVLKNVHKSTRQGTYNVL